MQHFHFMQNLQVGVLNREIAKYGQITKTYGLLSYSLYKERLADMVDIFWLIYHLTELLDRWWDRLPEPRKELFRKWQRLILDKIHCIDDEMQANIPRYHFDPEGHTWMDEVHYLFDIIRSKYEPFQFVLK